MFKRKETSKPVFISKNLDYLLNEHQIDIKNLSIETGVPAPSISRLKREGANPTIATLEPLLDFFRIDMKSFLYEDLSSSQYNNKKKVGEIIPIPIYSLDNFNSSKENIIQFIGASGVTNPKCFGVSIESEALFPVFQKNSTLIIDPDLQPHEGDFIFCMLDDNVSPVFRKIIFDGNTPYFKPINPAFGDPSKHKQYEILGVVIKSIETFR